MVQKIKTHCSGLPNLVWIPRYWHLNWSHPTLVPQPPFLLENWGQWYDTRCETKEGNNEQVSTLICLQWKYSLYHLCPNSQCKIGTRQVPSLTSEVLGVGWGTWLNWHLLDESVRYRFLSSVAKFPRLCTCVWIPTPGLCSPLPHLKLHSWYDYN